jgi:hypothetical protein
MKRDRRHIVKRLTLIAAAAIATLAIACGRSVDTLATPDRGAASEPSVTLVLTPGPLALPPGYHL